LPRALFESVREKWLALFDARKAARTGRTADEILREALVRTGDVLLARAMPPTMASRPSTSRKPQYARAGRGREASAHGTPRCVGGRGYSVALSLAHW
jgi:hypothetical protein